MTIDAVVLDTVEICIRANVSDIAGLADLAAEVTVFGALIAAHIIRIAREQLRTPLQC